jgi:alkanesulfonate monooxygenase SsuD/methylene tetrahydromethanopterin reductase-like flavin-dependent oxidoreductase (luciferase family)
MKFAPFFLIPDPGARRSFARRYDEVFDLIAHANDFDYEAVWFTEHHFSDYGYSPNPLMLLAKAAEVAPRLRLGTGILVLPLWHPVRLAEDIATLDVLSGGRFDLGIGRGYQHYEFDGLGVDLSQNRSMFEEALEIILGLLTTTDFSFEGKHWTVPATTLVPRTVQQPYPPVWMAATSPASIRRAVESGYHVSTGTGALVPELQQRNAYIDVCAAQAGISRSKIESVAARFVFCSTVREHIEDAIDQAQYQIGVSRFLSSGGRSAGGLNRRNQHQGEPSSDVFQERMIIGPPDECVRRLTELSTAGVTYVMTSFEFGGLEYRRVVDSFELFTAEVLPEVLGLTPKERSSEEQEADALEFAASPPEGGGF